MLKIQVTPLPVADMAAGPSKQCAIEANKKAQSFARFLRNTSRRDCCTEHYGEDSTITIAVRWDGTYDVIRSDFCCDQHAANYEFERPRHRSSSVAVNPFASRISPSVSGLLS